MMVYIVNLLLSILNSTVVGKDLHCSLNGATKNILFSEKNLTTIILPFIMT